MCGITGYINLNNMPLKDSGIILNMLMAQRHRGPDDSGIRTFNLLSGESQEIQTNTPVTLTTYFNGILGFNRLSILDLSINGHQPMASPNQKVLLTLNGEIYNAFDFKKELIQWGYNFKSTSDTEVVLALYLKYGIEGLLDRLNGMFAIVIVDLEKQVLYIARDRFGIKPMYFFLTERIFGFSSELKSFKFIEGFNFRLCEEQLDEYLIFRNNINGTLYRDIQSLQPGFYLAFTHEKGIAIKRYFDINKYTRAESKIKKIDDYLDNLEKWLGKSVRSQLMSDVKLGCQLSGGIDSSLVTWYANRNHGNSNFEAVSIVFNDPRFSEEKYISKVTDLLSIPSHRFLLDSNYYFSNIENVTWHLEAPINHPNTVAIYKLSQKAKEYVTVLLSGEGADEVFGGYERFYELSYPFKVRLLLHEIKKNIKDPSKILDYFNYEYRALMATAFMAPELAKKLRVTFQQEKAIDTRLKLYRSLSGSLFDRQVKYEMSSYLPDLLIRQDKMSMAHSIENRVPFLDNEVVENSFTIPEKYLVLKKSKEGINNEKYLLKKIMANVFGNDFAFRNKMGFGIPVREFFTNKTFIEYLNDKIVPGIKKRGLFNNTLISEWTSDIKNIRINELEALWVIVSFEIWASLYLDNSYENRHSRN
jgi:asparagine synthase (glutamine-hydrolysing)